MSEQEVYLKQYGWAIGNKYDNEKMLVIYHQDIESIYHPKLGRFSFIEGCSS